MSKPKKRQDYTPLEESLSKQLEAEKVARATDTQTLQREVERWRRLVPPRLYDLMGTYEPLRRLLHVLCEAADLADPMRGISFDPDSPQVNYSPHPDTQTPAAVSKHDNDRERVRDFSKTLNRLTGRIQRDFDFAIHRLEQSLGGEPWEYQPPPKPVCHRKTCTRRGVQQSYSAYIYGCGGHNKDTGERCGRTWEMPTDERP